MSVSCGSGKTRIDRTGAAPHIQGGQGRSAGDVERDGLAFGIVAALGALLLGMAFLLPGCVRCVDGIPVIRGDHADTRSDR